LYVPGNDVGIWVQGLMSWVQPACFLIKIRMMKGRRQAKKQES